MENIFGRIGYIDGGKPYPANILTNNTIPVQRYYNDYITSLAINLQHDYEGEWILKHYLLYFINSPFYRWPELIKETEKNIETLSAAEIIIELLRYNVEPFEL
jgi:hypothetical protein